MIRLIYGFIIMLLSAVLTIFLYIVASPIFQLLHIMLPRDSMYFTPRLESSLVFTWDTAWVWFVVFLVIFTVILCFAQIFLREQRMEEYY